MASREDRPGKAQSNPNATAHQKPFGNVCFNFREMLRAGKLNFWKITRKTARRSGKHGQSQTLRANSL